MNPLRWSRSLVVFAAVVLLEAVVFVGGAAVFGSTLAIANANDITIDNSATGHGKDAEARVARFSALRPGSELPPEWEPIHIAGVSRHTEYALASIDGVTSVRAVADSSVSGLGREVDIDPHATPWLQWHWRINEPNEQSGLLSKQGDDFPARVYVFFDFDIMRLSLLERIIIRIARALYGERLPLAALCYVWANDEPMGTTAWNAYTRRARMVVASSGAEKAEQWITVQRNVMDDFREAFGEPVPRITGIAIATDTDDTGARSVAWYGDILFSAHPQKDE
jgi:hypothetical protein